MLSIGKLKLSGESYYLNAVADGVDEYYRGVGEARGRWAGTARGLLELDGEVQPKDLHAVWAGEHPTTGAPLGRFPNRKVTGFDLTFRAPKSVSILAGLGDPDTARAVREAHESAVDAALSTSSERRRVRAPARTASNCRLSRRLSGGTAIQPRTYEPNGGHAHVITQDAVTGPRSCGRLSLVAEVARSPGSAQPHHRQHDEDRFDRQLGPGTGNDAVQGEPREKADEEGRQSPRGVGR